MSEENVDIVRRAIETFNARDVEDLVSLCDPECEFIPFRAQLEGVTYRGHEGMRRFVRDMDEDWERFRIEPSELQEREDRVGVVGRVTALGRGSRVNIESDAGFVFEVRAGLITRIVSYSDPVDALAAMTVPE